MRASLCAMVAAIVLAAHPAFAQTNRTAETFWKTVQATCDATAARPPSTLGQRIAQIAIDEFTRFGGHRIDSNGRLFHFGLTEAEHEEDDGGNPQVPLGHFGWWQVMKYWRILFGGDPLTNSKCAAIVTPRPRRRTRRRQRCGGPLRPSSCAGLKMCPILSCVKSCARVSCARRSPIPRGQQPSSAT